jgi:hypothetical protein
MTTTNDIRTRAGQTRRDSDATKSRAATDAKEGR